jgi:hypothetical protein
MKTAFKYFFFFVLFAILGFSREFIFVNINAQLFDLYYGHTDFKLPSSLSYFAKMNYDSLYHSKYVLTIAYYLAYFVVSYISVKITCVDKKYTRLIIYIYGLLLLLSGISMAYNYIFNNNLDGDEYTFSRWLMGIAQSPLVAFFMIAANKLYKKIQTQP